jgi:beta-lactamase regulating signal transducer with metallopeptidase domain
MQKNIKIFLFCALFILSKNCLTQSISPTDAPSSIAQPADNQKPNNEIVETKDQDQDKDKDKIEEQVVIQKEEISDTVKEDASTEKNNDSISKNIISDLFSDFMENHLLGIWIVGLLINIIFFYVFSKFQRPIILKHSVSGITKKGFVGFSKRTHSIVTKYVSIPLMA